MQNSNDLTVYIGRFSPFHRGHAEVLKRALLTSQRVLVLVGSSGQPRNIKNPFSFEERAQMIYGYVKESPSLKDLDPTRICIMPIVDIPYNDQQWLAQVQEKIEIHRTALAKANGDDRDVQVTLTGCSRDESCKYLNWFPTFKMDLVEENEAVSRFLSATTVRQIFFARRFNGQDLETANVDMLLRSFVPTATMGFLNQFEHHPDFPQLCRENGFIDKYHKAWETAPYAPIFVTTDAVVIQAGHVLLIKRRSEPGKGLYALPGGFLEQNERLVDGVVRELVEETRIKVQDKILKRCIVRKEIFDQPDRSLRGRTITVAYLFQLAEVGELPHIKGSDDAEKAEWVSLAQVANMRSVLFEDHYDIIMTMIGGAL